MSKNNISTIVEECLCTACGTCKSVCPKGAISLRENTAGFIYADMDDTKCISCGLCRISCPSDKEHSILPEDPFHGKCIKAYLAHSCDPNIRQSSQSGGLVTALLCFLLDNNKIDGAVVNRYNPSNKRTEAFYTESREAIIQSSGSKYTQSSVVPVVFDNSDKRLAAVTLGCQAESIFQLRKKSPDKIKGLQYIIGLVCIGQNSGHMTEKLISLLNLSSEETEAIYSFRSKDKDFGGWPGNVSIKTPNAQYTLPKNRRIELRTIYESYRCLLCYDQMNVFSDIVCGDPWGINHEGLKAGYTVVISRTNKGQKLLEDAQGAGYVVLEEVSFQSVFKGQTVDDRQVKKVRNSKIICDSNNWLYPYPECSAFNMSSSAEVDKAIRDRLNFTRTYYKSSKEEEILLSKERYKKVIIDRRKKNVINFFKKVFRKGKSVLTIFNK